MVLSFPKGVRREKHIWTAIGKSQSLFEDLYPVGRDFENHNPNGNTGSHTKLVQTCTEEKISNVDIIIV